MDGPRVPIFRPSFVTELVAVTLRDFRFFGIVRTLLFLRNLFCPFDDRDAASRRRESRARTTPRRASAAASRPAARDCAASERKNFQIFPDLESAAITPHKIM
ncbi:hypothetical protein EVAR_46630_1 [Eumeta japonica]|uniref:Uncharacterized protein n=1 Tax=Eumeta variegata TaxID=151549 RepID=A0A4C1WF74_EUMVA|nr:hypothetical protein EVAR_46630_1 [Eumeta japonica]